MLPCYKAWTYNSIIWCCCQPLQSNWLNSSHCSLFWHLLLQIWTTAICQCKAAMSMGLPPHQSDWLCMPPLWKQEFTKCSHIPLKQGSHMQCFPANDSNFLVPLACHVQAAVCNNFSRAEIKFQWEVQVNSSLLCQNSSFDPVTMLWVQLVLFSWK